MSRYASVFVGFCSAFASHGAAFAQGEPNFPPLPENGVVFITQNGTYTRRTLSNVEVDTLMQQSATAVPTGLLLLRHDGKLYVSIRRRPRTARGDRSNAWGVPDRPYGHLEVTDDFGFYSVLDDGAGLGTRLAAPPWRRF